MTCTALATGTQAGTPTGIAFTKRPVARRVGDRVRIAFAVNRATDVAASVQDARGRTVRHLAVGMLAEHAPAPLKTGLEQDLVWDGKDDLGNVARGGPVAEFACCIKDNNGEPHDFYVESFYNRHDLLTLFVAQQRLSSRPIIVPTCVTV